MLRKVIILILKIPISLFKGIIRFLLWILKHIFGFLFGWIPDIDERMSGEDFEEYVQEVLVRNGYKDVILTKRSGDFGVDILATFKHTTYAIQCKLYSRPVGVSAIQQATAGCVYYECDQAVVVTNHRFTSQAIALAKANDVELWDGEMLKRMKRRANSRSILKRYKTPHVEHKKTTHPYDAVIELLINEGYASSSLLNEHLDMSMDKAFYILEDLEYHNLVSHEDHLGMRDIYFLSYEEAIDQLNENDN